MVKNIKKSKKDKRNKILEREFNESNNDSKRIIKILVGIIVFFALVYFIAALLTGEIKLKKEKKVVNIQYDEILVEQTFKQKDSTYYVFYYDFSDESNEDLNLMIVSMIDEKNIVFKSDTSNVYNKKFVVDDDTLVKSNPNNISDLKIKEPTLIKINNGKVVNYINGYDKIKSFVKGII